MPPTGGESGPNGRRVPAAAGAGGDVPGAALPTARGAGVKREPVGLAARTAEREGGGQQLLE